MRSHRLIALALVVAALAVLAACGSDDDDDEGDGGGAATSAEQADTCARELKDEGMTMLIATHEMGFARDVANEVCFLHDGRILERGAPGRVLSAPEQPETQRFLRRLLEAGRL